MLWGITAYENNLGPLHVWVPLCGVRVKQGTLPSQLLSAQRKNMEGAGIHVCASLPREGHTSPGDQAQGWLGPGDTSLLLRSQCGGEEQDQVPPRELQQSAWPPAKS